MSNNDLDLKKRRLLTLGAVAATSPVWVKPVINTIVLPAHAQTSMCTTDITVGGPLAGHPSGAATCQAACESEASSRGAQLCAVDEVDTGSGIDCSCELDLP